MIDVKCWKKNEYAEKTDYHEDNENRQPDHKNEYSQIHEREFNAKCMDMTSFRSRKEKNT